MKIKLVEIVWRDIQTHAGWHDGGKHIPDLKAYGLLVNKDKDTITLASCYDPDTKKWADPMDYPKGCVKSLRIIETITP